MRKISEDAAAAFWQCRSFKRNNTVVRAWGDGSVTMELWGNRIAYRDEHGTYIYHCDWHTNTTRDRLNALGAGIRRINGVFHREKTSLGGFKRWIEMQDKELL